MPNDLPDSLSREAILKALDRINSGEPPPKGFAESTVYDLFHEGRTYSPKVVVAMATGTSNNFTGGASSKCFRLLLDAGFTIEPQRGAIPFTVGRQYSRKDVGVKLIIDRTEDTTKGDWGTGYHFHKTRHGGMCFIFCEISGVGGRTGHKYRNTWKDQETLEWFGTASSKISNPSIQRMLSGQHPVLIFTRAGSRGDFTFHGTGSPVETEDTSPARIVWKLAGRQGDLSDDEADRVETVTEDSPPGSNPTKLTDEDARKAVLRSIKQRRGQPAFRNRLRVLHHDSCQITGTSVHSALEAAHIKPYRNEADNQEANGLLLRSDIHTLFDLNLLAIEPGTLKIHIDDSLLGSEYEKYHGNVLVTNGQRPHPDALMSRWSLFRGSMPMSSS